MQNSARNIVIFGYGGVGKTLANIIAERHPEVQLTIVDKLPLTSGHLPPSTEFHQLDINDPANDAQLESIISKADLAYTVVTYDAIEKVARLALKHNVDVVAPTESTHITNQLNMLATEAAKQGQTARVCPQAGLSPGHSGVVAKLLVKGLQPEDELEYIQNIRIRVGALQDQDAMSANGQSFGPFNHGDTWSPESMFMEYVEPVQEMIDGKPQWVDPLMHPEDNIIEGKHFVSRTTAGGLSDLIEWVAREADSHPGFVDENTQINYKSIRYPSHREHRIKGHWNAVIDHINAIFDEYGQDYGYDTLSLSEKCAVLCNRDHSDGYIQSVDPDSAEGRVRQHIRHEAENQFRVGMQEGYTDDDLVLVQVVASGRTKSGEWVTRTYQDAVRPVEQFFGETATAISATTSAGLYACGNAIFQDQAREKLPPGPLGQTDFDPADYYATGTPAERIYGSLSEIWSSKVKETKGKLAGPAVERNGSSANQIPHDESGYPQQEQGFMR